MIKTASIRMPRPGRRSKRLLRGIIPRTQTKNPQDGAKRVRQLLLAGCLVLSMVGGAGGAVIAAKSGLLGTGCHRSVLKGLEVPSAKDRFHRRRQLFRCGAAGGGQRSGHHHRKCGDQLLLPAVCTQGAGSGVVLTADGYIVTNYHVIKGAQQITVTANDGSTYAATLVGTDEDNDIAVLKVDAKDLTPAILGDSDTLKVGDAVLAIGNPLGTLSGTVTDGIVSALERQVTIDAQRRDPAANQRGGQPR